MHLILITITTFVHGYAIFLCFAIHDYQDEKPRDEKCPIDILTKDFMKSKFLLLCYSFLVQLISLSIPPTTSINAYMISHLGIFIANFHSISMLVLVYIQHIYIFHHDEFLNVNFSSMRWKCLAWKFLLTIINLLLNFLVPSQEIPLPFQLLSKGKPYER